MGTLWNRSGTVERYGDDLRAAGALAYFFEGGTTDPLTVYRDSGATSDHPHPVVADANGRWPDVFVPFIASYDVQVTSSGGTQLSYSVEIPNADPAGAPPVTILPEQLVATGAIHAEMINASKAGYVRLNGRTLGNATSGATERANADTAALFTYLWNNMSDTLLGVSGGRGASAAIDYAANKTIQLPDARGSALVGLDGMGNSPGNFFTGLTFLLGDTLTPGSSVGSNFIAILQANLPAVGLTGTTGNQNASHTHSGTTGDNNVLHNHSGTTDAGSAHSHTFSGSTDDASADHTHIYSISGSNNQSGIQSGGGLTANSGIGSASTGGQSNNHHHDFSGTTSSESTHTHSITVGTDSTNHQHPFTSGNESANHQHTFTTSNLGSGTAMNNLGRSFLVTWYIKL